MSQQVSGKDSVRIIITFCERLTFFISKELKFG